MKYFETNREAHVYCHTKKQTGKEKINRESAREYRVHFFSFFILILIQHFGGKNLQKSDKKSTKHNHACKYTE